ncbi:MAG: class IV adenylate cyclase [Asgard group archaeon]|nr:class IV adenylate cyclase [Asgard group archaeon]
MFDIEIKARYKDHNKAREFLKANGARFHGIDQQIDVYFKVKNGRLKLRKGEIENALVYYTRDNVKDIKVSEYYLYHSQDPELLESILRHSLGVLIEVRKKREMHYIDNIKFNLDVVDELGTFIEIEAMTDDESDFQKLKLKVEKLIEQLEIPQSAIQSHSYSDLLIEKRAIPPGTEG